MGPDDLVQEAVQQRERLALEGALVVNGESGQG